MTSATRPTDAEILAALYLIAPEFKTLDPLKEADYLALLALLDCQINTAAASCCGAYAYALRLAHELTLSADPSIGVKSSMSLGDASIGYKISDSSLQSTSYGMRYEQLIRKYRHVGYVTGTQNIAATMYGIVGPYGPIY